MCINNLALCGQQVFAIRIAVLPVPTFSYNLVLQSSLSVMLTQFFPLVRSPLTSSLSRVVASSEQHTRSVGSTLAIAGIFVRESQLQNTMMYLTRWLSTWTSDHPK